MLEIKHYEDEGLVLVVQPFHELGSLRDYMHKVSLNMLLRLRWLFNTETKWRLRILARIVFITKQKNNNCRNINPFRTNAGEQLCN